MKKLLLGVTLITLAGCTSLQDAVDTAYIIKANEGVVETVLKADLTDSEVAVVIDAEQAMLGLADYLEGVVEDPTTIVLLDAKVKDVAARYDLAKDITINHKEFYELYDWEGLVAFHAQMSAMYSRYEDFMAKQKYQEAASQLGEYFKLGMKIAVLYGV